MAANDELPRGWSMSGNAAAGAINPTLIIPAAPGIVHVLTDVQVLTWASTGGPGVQAAIAVNGSAGANWIGVITLVAGSGEAEFDWSGHIPGAPGQQVSVELLDTVPAATGVQLNIKGYSL